MNSKVAETVEEANADTITRKYIRFYPKGGFREMCSLKNINIKISDWMKLKTQEEVGDGDGDGEDNGGETPAEP